MLTLVPSANRSTSGSLSPTTGVPPLAHPESRLGMAGMDGRGAARTMTRISASGTWRQSHQSHAGHVVARQVRRGEELGLKTKPAFFSGRSVLALMTQRAAGPSVFTPGEVVGCAARPSIFTSGEVVTCKAAFFAIAKPVLPATPNAPSATRIVPNKTSSTSVSRFNMEKRPPLYWMPGRAQGFRLIYGLAGFFWITSIAGGCSDAPPRLGGNFDVHPNTASPMTNTAKSQSAILNSRVVLMSGHTTRARANSTRSDLFVIFAIDLLHPSSGGVEQEAEGHTQGHQGAPEAR